MPCKSESSKIHCTESNVEVKITTSLNNCSHGSTSYVAHTMTDSDSSKNLRMSIRRKRVCSGSSVFSNNENSADDVKKSGRRLRKKRKRMLFF